MARRENSEKQWCPIVVLAAALLLYSPSWKGEFVSWGDGKGVVKNPAVHGLTLKNLKILFEPFHSSHLERKGEYLPVRDLSYLVDSVFWELNPLGYHLGNTFVFLAGVAAFYSVLKRILPAGRGACAALFLFAFHPMHVESVAWISSRKFLLAFLFSSVAFLLFLKLQEERRGREYLACLIAYAAALASHPISGVLPLIFTIYHPLSGGPGRKGVRSVFAGLLWLIPFFAITGLWAFLLVKVQDASRASSGASHESLYTSSGAVPFVAAGMIWRIIGRYLFPVGLSTIYQEGAGDPFSSFRPICLVGLIGLLVVGAVLLYHAQRGGFFLLAFLVSLLPFLGLFPLSQYSADRYLLISGSAFIPLVVTLFLGAMNSLGGRKQVFLFTWGSRILWGAAVLVLGVLSFQRVKTWESDLAFWKDAVRKAPNHALAQFQLGRVLFGEGGAQEALACFEKAMELDPGLLEAYYQAAELLCSLGEPSKGMELMERALKQDPENRLSLLHYVSTLVAKRSFLQAEEILLRFQREDPNDPLILHYLGKLYFAWGDRPRGIALLERAVDGLEGPWKIEAVGILAGEYELIQQWDVAKMYYEILLALEKNKRNQGIIRMKIGQMEKHVKHADGK